MSTLAATWAILRRELAGYFHAPIAYVVGVVFLVVQGLSFWAVVKVLADAGQRAPQGAVLRDHFGGTFMYWSLLFVVVAAISMRLVAEDKQRGSWEALLTTPVGEEAVLLGKWLAAVGFFIMLWLPTLLYMVVLRAYAPPAATIDPGPVIAAYVGVIVSGMAFLAIGLAASTATANQIIAAMASFAILLTMLFVGELDDLVPGWLDAHSSVAGVVEFADLRRHMAGFARGEIASEAIVFYLGVSVVALVLAVTLAVVGRRRRSEIQGRLLATGLVAAIVVMVGILAARHRHTWDLTRGQLNSLSSATAAVLAAVEEPVIVLSIRPGLDSFAAVHTEVDRLLTRMVDAQPLLQRRRLDPVMESERVEALAIEYAISIADLTDGGAVVLQVGSRTRVVDLLDMAGFDRDDLGVGSLARFRAEEAIATALAELIDLDRPVLCATSTHGELALTGPVSWAALASRLRGDGMVVQALGGVAGGVPAHCRALVVMGGERAFAAAETLAVADYLGGGGRLFLAAPTRLAGGGASFVATGLELPLGNYGIELTQTLAMEPGGQRWATIAGYGEHAITRPFDQRRPTVWQRARGLGLDQLPAHAASVLIATSAQGWGERSLAPTAAAVRDGGDGAGPVAVAVAVAAPPAPGRPVGARLVVVGSERSLAGGEVELGANEMFAAAALTWLTGRDRTVAVGDKTPESLRLLMTAAQLRSTFVVVVVFIPLLFAMLGGWMWRRRRG